MSSPEQEPHRVIYLHQGKPTARVFGDYKTAKEFADKIAGSRIQKASEPVDIPTKRGHRMMNNSLRTTKVPCECGNGNRLTSEQHCYSCSGQLDQSNRGARLARGSIANSCAPARVKQ